MNKFQALQGRNRPPISMALNGTNEDYTAFYDLWAYNERADALQWDQVLHVKLQMAGHYQWQEAN